MVYNIFTEKGGVGKTALAVNVAYYLHRKGYSVLLVDYDPQANLTLLTGQYKKSTQTIVDALLENANTEEIILHTEFCGDLIPSEHGMADIDPDQNDLERILAPVRDKYDFIFIDNNPGEGKYLASSLYASDKVIIPLEGVITSTQALGRNVNIVNTVAKVKPELTIDGFIIVQYDDSTKSAQEFAEAMRKIANKYNVPVYDTVISYTRAMKGAQNNCLPLEEYSKRSGACKDYEAFADELIKNEWKGRK